MEAHEREHLAEWCSILGSYPPDFYLRMSDEELLRHYNRLIGEDEQDEKMHM